MSTTQATLRRVEIRSVLRRHKGSQAEVARNANVSRVSVNKWLKGLTTSANIAEAAEKKALELLDMEKLHAA